MIKYRVTMTNAFALPDGQVRTEQVVDYVPLEYVRQDGTTWTIDEYENDARTRWQSVQRSDEPDYGPGGPDGATETPAGLGGN